MQLKLDKTIPLGGIHGKIAQIAVNEEKQIAYLAVIGNNSLIAVDLQTGLIVHIIKELNEPQGVAYVAQNNTIVVTNAGDGKCTVYDAATYEELRNLSLTYDADEAHYCPSLNKIFIGYGDGGVSVINADSFSVASDLKLPTHPFSFAVDEGKQKLFVNVPVAQKIFVFDLKTEASVAQWDPQASANYAMALDTNDNRLFIACHNPAKLEVFDTQGGNMVYSMSCAADADDMFYNPYKKEIYVSCGAGYVDVIKQKDADHYDNVAKIQTRIGARTSLFVPGLNVFLVALPAALGKEAELRVYKPTQANSLAKK